MQDEKDGAKLPAVEADPIEQWLSERHKWLQTAAAKMVQSRSMPDAETICHLADLCLAEASNQPNPSFEAVAPGSIAQAASQRPVRLLKISDISGVNAIKPGATLEFAAQGITVIYGSNGSGKSGFSRLIKQICGSRAKEDLLGNVFDDKNPEPSARVVIGAGDVEREGEWTLSRGPVPALRHVHVFDSSVASLYFGPKNEATYEPSRMRFISSLIKTCDNVATELNERKAKLQSTLPKFPADLAETPAAKWLSGLKAGTSAAAIEGACRYTDEMDQERIAGEATLAEKDIPGRVKTIEREIVAVGNVQKLVEGWKTELGDDKLAAIVGARVDAQKKRKLATEDAAKVFAGAPLDGVGQESWRQLWEKAREYSLSHAYKESEYPNTEGDAKCVLCQQQLDADARVRLRSFESFVKGALEKDAKEAERKLSDSVKGLPKLPSSEAWVASVGAIKLDEANASGWLDVLLARRNAAETAVDIAALPPIDWNVVEACVATVTTALNSEKKALMELLQDGKRKQLTARVQELLGTQWLSREKEAIEVEVNRLNMMAALTKAITLTSTGLLTKKNTELSEQELKSGYQDRFSWELKALGGGRLPVEPRSKQQGKGKVTFTLTIKEASDDVKAEAILSEGERRIIALAAFLADIAGSGNLTPFVFDDPISSLDQDFEEHVVERLVRLAQERQVIVFTHRLSLLALVETVVRKLKVQADLEKKPSPVELQTTSLRRLGKSAGLIADFSVRDTKPEKALNKLRDETLKGLRKSYAAGDVAAYEERAKSFCSDFRILVERCVELILLNEIIVRFRRSITTQGRIGALAKIHAADCAMIDELMTRYSVFEHSQSGELPAQCPDIETLEKDHELLAQWVKEFGARAV
ncbi:chromosome segregation protein SMC [Burkholderia sp. Bp8963]|uniref:AAA family ATPase n=1 Tax=Burkholderia sp. Bp8963 TaxID=2184547 RepID=UPI000F5B4E06|nr:AAA family ATPase [Burkholderia sp. Bp8963]RQS64280.1 chromosome segregation protein SMC [Burkholderia sp. Bp8963]